MEECRRASLFFLRYVYVIAHWLYSLVLSWTNCLLLSQLLHSQLSLLANCLLSVVCSEWMNTFPWLCPSYIPEYSGQDLVASTSAADDMHDVFTGKLSALCCLLRTNKQLYRYTYIDTLLSMYNIDMPPKKSLKRDKNQQRLTGLFLHAQVKNETISKATEANPGADL